MSGTRPADPSIAVAFAFLILLVADLGIGLATAQTATEQAPPDIYFTCDARPVPEEYAIDGPTGEDGRVYERCPIRVYDDGGPEADALATTPVDTTPASFLGNLVVLGGATNSSHIGILGVAGQPAGNDADPTARTGRTHAFLGTTNDGGGWNRSHAPEAWPSPAHVGRSVAATTDNDGNVWAAFLWNLTGATGPRSQIAVAQGGNVTTGVALMAALEQEPLIIEPADPSRYITKVSLQHAQRGAERIVVAWHEMPVNRTGNATLDAGRIHAAWYAPGGDADITTPEGATLRNGWQFLDPQAAIGPCDGMSDLETDGRHLYLLCVAGAGYDARLPDPLRPDEPVAEVRVGHVDAWTIDPWLHETNWRGFTGILGDHAQLSVLPDGYMVATSTLLRNEQRLHADAAFGWTGDRWDTIRIDLGSALRSLSGEGAVVDAGITALEVTNDRRTVFLVYKEWPMRENGTNPTGPLVPRGVATDPDQALHVDLDGMKKHIVAFDECRGIIASREIDMGEGMKRKHVEAFIDDPGVFNDHQDSLTLANERSQDVVLTAIGDHGRARYGKLIVSGAEGYCFVAPPSASVALPVEQTELGTDDPVAQRIGFAFGGLALAGIAYLLVSKTRIGGKP